jgi:hypothetical protein
VCYANQRGRYCIGAQWLSTLGTIGLNLQEQFIRFYENGEKYKLQGINCPPPQIVSSNRMEKMIKKGAQAYFLHFYAIEGTTNEYKNDDPKKLDKILGKYSTIFQEPPCGLPPPPSIKEYVINSKVPAVKDYLATLDEILRTLKAHLEQARNQIKQQTDKRTDQEFMTRYWVFIQLQPYKQSSLKNYKKHKLAPNFYGPYQIRKRISQVAYTLDIPNKGKLHEFFHVSCLKKKLGPTIHIQT